MDLGDFWICLFVLRGELQFEIEIGIGKPYLRGMFRRTKKKEAIINSRENEKVKQLLSTILKSFE